MLELDRLSKKFGKLVAVDHLSFLVKKSELFGFLGANGAGKTTTINMLAGLLKPTSGTARIGGYDLRTEAIAVKKLSGFLPENPKLYPNLTGREFIKLVAGFYEIPPQQSEKRMSELFDRLRVGAMADQLTKTYSHGTRKKIALIGVLAHEPQFFFLDEPMTHLDPKSRFLLKEILKEQINEGKTIFMATHQLELAEQICHRIAVIDSGKLVTIDTIAQLRSRNPKLTLEEIFLKLTEGTGTPAK